MSSRQTILDRLRSRLVDRTELPSLEGPWIQFTNPVEAFVNSATFVGAKVIVCESIDQLRASIQETLAQLNPKMVVSSAIDLVAGTVDTATIDDPHDLADLDLVVAWTKLAVAENGAVWLDDRELRQRVIYFITQHMILLVRASEIVHNMHQAYDRVSIDGGHFGLFLSGPSKTADIEQSLVLGAHGSRTLKVLIARDL